MEENQQQTYFHSLSTPYGIFYEKLEQHERISGNTDRKWKNIIQNKDGKFILTLFLNCCGIDDQNVTIVISKQLLILRQINEDDNLLTAAGVKQLVPKQWPKLRILTLDQNNIGCRGVKFLIKVDFPVLDYISMDSCKVGTQGIKHLSKSKWPNLLNLSMSCNYNQLDGYEAIINAHLPKLVLFIKHNYMESGRYYQQCINVLTHFAYESPEMIESQFGRRILHNMEQKNTKFLIYK